MPSARWNQKEARSDKLTNTWAGHALFAEDYVGASSEAIRNVPEAGNKDLDSGRGNKATGFLEYVDFGMSDPCAKEIV